MTRRIRTARETPAVTDPEWIFCSNDGCTHPVFGDKSDCFPNRIVAKAAWRVWRARCWGSSSREGSKPPHAATVYDGITKLSYGRFVTEADAAKPPNPPTYASPALRLLNPPIGFSGLRPWEATRDPDGLFAMFVEATETDIANAISEKSKFPEIADPLDRYVQALQIRREIVAEGRDRTGERNGDLLDALQDFEKSQQG